MDNDRKLTTIFALDIVGYSALVGANEQEAINALRNYRKLIDPFITKNNGRIFNTGGDSIFADFSSPVNGLRCAIFIQRMVYDLNLAEKIKPSMRFRIGLHIGDVLIQGSDLLGEAVNIAARIEQMADYGGVSMSESIYLHTKNSFENERFIDGGFPVFKNIKESIHVYSIEIAGTTPNPNLIQKVSAQSYQETVKGWMKDPEYATKKIMDAQNFKRSGQYDKAVKILIIRVLKGEMDANEELISMVEKKLIPQDFHNFVVDTFVMVSKKLNSNDQTKFGLLLSNYALGKDNKFKSLYFWKMASNINDEAKFHLGKALLEDPTTSVNETKEAITYLTDAAMMKNVAAAVILGLFYSDKNRDEYDESTAFKWLWVAREFKDSKAQVYLEALVKTMNKATFVNSKIVAESLVDQIRWNVSNN